MNAQTTQTANASKVVMYFVWQYDPQRSHLKTYRGVAYGFDAYDAAGEARRINGPGVFQIRTRDNRIALQRA